MAIDKPLIIKQADKLATAGDTVVTGLESALAKFERLVIADSSKLVVANSAEIALAKENIKKLLVDSGYYEQVGVLINKDYQAAINESHKAYKSMTGKSFRFSDKSLSQLNITKQLDLNKFGVIANDAVEKISSGLIELQFGTVTQEELVTSLIGKATGVALNQAKTQVHTGLQGYYRASNVNLAKDAGIEKFEYVGPSDSVTRDFCLDHVGEIMTMEEWDALDNGQLSPVSIFGGGYNCRHQLIGVTEDEKASPLSDKEKTELKEERRQFNNKVAKKKRIEDKKKAV
jgi:hypothetical protein